MFPASLSLLASWPTIKACRISLAQYFLTLPAELEFYVILRRQANKSACRIPQALTQKLLVPTDSSVSTRKEHTTRAAPRKILIKVRVSSN
jgi:hypothetical protein